MAWTDVRYQCGHEERVQLLGAGRDRDARAWSYSQRLCPVCYRARMETLDDGSPRRPSVVEHVGDGRAEFEVWHTFDCWHRLAHRGYMIEDRLPPGRTGGEGGRAQPYLDHQLAPAYVRTVHSRADYWAEREWLAAECNAILPEDAQSRRAPKRYKPPTVPRRLAAANLSPGLALRVEQATHRIRLALRRATRPYIAFSGGKDSTTVLALVHAVDPAIPAIWSDDELEMPETVALMERLRYAIAGPFRIVAGHTTHAGWFTSWHDAPYWREPLPDTEAIPGLMDDWATGEGYDLTILGLRGDESKVRAAFLSEAGATYRRRTGLACNPIWDWDHETVWRFIEATGADYNAAYDRYRALDLPPELQRVGPLPLSPRATLELGWPDLLARLEARYGPRWI